MYTNEVISGGFDNPAENQFLRLLMNGEAFALLTSHLYFKVA